MITTTSIPGIDYGGPSLIWDFFTETHSQLQRGIQFNIHLKRLDELYEPLCRFYNCLHNKRYPRSSMWKNFAPMMKALSWKRED